MQTVMVTGGAGFIGSAVVRLLVEREHYQVINVDKLTYAGNLESLASVNDATAYHFVQADIGDAEAIAAIMRQYRPDTVMHLAAETHVDRSIDSASPFIQANVIGTWVLLEVCRRYCDSLSGAQRENFRFHHISTDEVYGSLGDSGQFTEQTRYDPSSPYSASKASSDHLVRAWHRTYDLPIVVSNCSNNYGPFQFPEKLIPLMILNALEGKPLPVYGEGRQVRDWLYVDDHARALLVVAKEGIVGETYNIGGHNTKTNLDVVNAVCEVLEEKIPSSDKGIQNYQSLIQFVADRPGHDYRYAIDASKIERELGWTPQESFESGLKKTVDWYLTHESWWRHVLDGSYKWEQPGLGKR